MKMLINPVPSELRRALEDNLLQPLQIPDDREIAASLLTGEPLDLLLLRREEGR
jgi:hypothetical protein